MVLKIQILALPLPSPVFWAKAPTFPEPKFPHLWNGIRTGTNPAAYGMVFRIEQTNQYKGLGSALHRLHTIIILWNN